MEIVNEVDEYGMMVDENGVRWGIPSTNFGLFISRQNAGEKHLGNFAIKAIQEIAEIGYPIPEVLLPWLNDACNAWKKQQGNTISNYETNEIWEFRIQDTYKLILAGYAKKKAFEAIADRDGVEWTSVKRHYYGEYAGEREVVEYRIAYAKELNAKYAPDTCAPMGCYEPQYILNRKR